VSAGLDGHPQLALREGRGIDELDILDLDLGGLGDLEGDGPLAQRLVNDGHVLDLGLLAAGFLIQLEDLLLVAEELPLVQRLADLGG
jgi:hypothetical protein